MAPYISLRCASHVHGAKCTDSVTAPRSTSHDKFRGPTWRAAVCLMRQVVTMREQCTTTLRQEVASDASLMSCDHMING
jgi:hypothetical protein